MHDFGHELGMSPAGASLKSGYWAQELSPEYLRLDHLCLRPSQEGQRDRRTLVLPCQHKGQNRLESIARSKVHREGTDRLTDCHVEPKGACITYVFRREPGQAGNVPQNAG